MNLQYKIVQMFSLDDLLAFGKSFGSKVSSDISDSGFGALKSDFYSGDQIDFLVGVDPGFFIEEKSSTSPSTQISALLKNAGIDKTPIKIVDNDPVFGFVASLTKLEANALSNIKGVTSFDLVSISNVSSSSVLANVGTTEVVSAAITATSDINFDSSSNVSSSSVLANVGTKEVVSAAIAATSDINLDSSVVDVSFANEIATLTNDVVYGVENSTSSLALESNKWEVYLPQYWVGDEVVGDLDTVTGFAQEDFIIQGATDVYNNGKAVSGDDLPYGVKAVWGGKDVTDLNEDGISDYDADGLAVVGEGKDYTGYYAFVIDSGVLKLANNDLNYSEEFDPTDVAGSNAAKAWSKSFVNGADAFTDTNGHGTHVAGTIAAKANGKGVVGVAPGATIVSLKVFGSGGASFATITNAVNYAVGVITDNNLDKSKCVINMSLGGGFNAGLESAIQTAADAGIIFAVAAGNSSKDVDKVSPAAAGDNANVYTVSAVDNKYKMASWSNYDSIEGAGSDDCDVAGPGVAVKSYYKNGSISFLSGTSMAAPAVAGLLLAGDGEIKKGPMVIANSKGWSDPFALQKGQIAEDTPGNGGNDEDDQDGKNPGKEPGEDGDPAVLDFNGLINNDGSVKEDTFLYKAYGSFDGVNGTYALTTGQGSIAQDQLETVLGVEAGKLDEKIEQASEDKVGINFAPVIPIVDKAAIDVTEGSGANAKSYANVGDKITFQYSFASNDYSPYNDYAFFTLSDNTYSLASLGGAANGGGVPDNGSQNGTAEIVLQASDLYKKGTLDNATNKYDFVKIGEGDTGGFFNFSVGVVDAIDTCVTTSLLVKELTVLGKDEEPQDEPEKEIEKGTPLDYVKWGTNEDLDGLGDVLMTGSEEAKNLKFSMSTGAQKYSASEAPILQGIMEFNLGLNSNILDSDLDGTTTAIDATEGSAIQVEGYGEIGGTVSFGYVFSTDDYAPYKDFSWYSVNGKVQKIAKVADDCPNFGSTGGTINYVLTEEDFAEGKNSGNVSLNIGVMDVKDWCVTSSLDVFNIVIDGVGDAKEAEKVPTKDDITDENGDLKPVEFKAYGSTGDGTIADISGVNTYKIDNKSGSLSQGMIEYELGLDSGTLDGNLNNTKPSINATEGSYLKAKGVASVGDSIMFNYKFITNDYTPFNDFSYYSINGKAYKLTALGLDFNLETDAPDQAMKEGSASYTFTSNDFNGNEIGNYTLGIGVMDALDTAVDTELELSGFQFVQSKDDGGGAEEISDKLDALIKYGKVGGNAQGSKETGFKLTNGGCGGATEQSELEAGLSLNLGSLDKQMAGWGTDLNGKTGWTKNATNATEGSGLWATGTAKVGDVASFDFAFDTNDYTPYADYAFYGIATKAAGAEAGVQYTNKSLTSLAAIGQNVQNYNKDSQKSEKFKTVEYTFKDGDFGANQTEGSYKFSFGVVDVKDTCVLSTLYVKGFQVTNQGENKGSGGFNVNGFGVDGISSASDEDINPDIEEFGNTFFDLNSEMATMSTGDGALSQIFLEDALGLKTGVLDNIAGNSTEGSACKGSVEAAVGDVVSFKYNMWTNDYIPYQDFAFYTINGNAKKIAEVGVDLDSFDSTTGIVNYLLTADDFKSGAESGFVDITIGIMDVKDSSVDSYLEVSDFYVGSDSNETELASMGIAAGSALTQLVDASGNFVKFTFNGQVVGDDYTDTWNVAAAKDIGNGFNVVLKGDNAKSGYYKFVTTDVEGTALTQGDWVTESEAVSKGYESEVGIDLNDNGLIENAASAAAASQLNIYNTGVGALTLKQLDGAGGLIDIAEKDDLFSVVVSNEANPDMAMFSGGKVNNILVKGEGDNAGQWQSWQAETDLSTGVGNIGQEVDVSKTGADWKTTAEAVTAGFEVKYKYDLNGNGLLEGGENYELAGENGQSFILKNEKGIVYNDASSPNWNATNAFKIGPESSANAGGFKILLTGQGDYVNLYQVAEANEFGVFTQEFGDWKTGAELAAAGFETLFNENLDGLSAYVAVEDKGNVTLAKDALGFYAVTSTTLGDYLALTFDGVAISDNTYLDWDLIAAEENGLLWKNLSSDKLIEWKVDNEFNLVSYELSDLGSASFKSAETTYGVDGNGDGITGTGFANLESEGNLFAAVNENGEVAVDNSLVKFNGSNVNVNQFAGWQYKAAESLDPNSNGVADYILWYNSSQKTAAVWELDSSQQYVDVQSFSANSDLLELEDTFSVDLTGDAIAGTSTVNQLSDTVSVALKQIGSGGLFIDTAAASDIELTNSQGLSIDTAGLLALGWTAIYADDFAGKNKLIWANEESGEMAAWNYNADWSSYVDYDAFDVNSVEANSLEAVATEDINGDGYKGTFYNTIEAKGVTELVKDQSEQVYIKKDGIYNAVFGPDGSHLKANQFTGWSLLGTEVVDGLNQLVFEFDSTGDLSVWTLDNTYTYTNSSVVTSDSDEYGIQEANFYQDLDQNAAVGASGLAIASSTGNTVVESQGSVDLVYDSENKVFAKTESNLTEVQIAGSAVKSDQFDGWSLVGAETFSDGSNKVIWESESNGDLSVWTVDSNWNYTSSIVADKNKAYFANVEQNLQQDVDEDGLIGSLKTTIEEGGGTALVKDDFTKLFAFSNGVYTAITDSNGDSVGSKEFEGWSLKAAENVGGVNKILWKEDQTKGVYSIWSLDKNWSFTGFELAGVNDFASLETDFVKDLNGNGVLGQ
ncbi:S8 family serine peptidase [Synechococcus sp. AH-601-C19]|nr:S8 family serine peptidase [Synechococcus sp. AH-601-C19]